MKQKKIMAIILIGFMTFSVGCSGVFKKTGADPPLPDNWSVRSEEEEENSSVQGDDEEHTDAEENADVKEENTVEISEVVNYLFDTSGSMNRAPAVIKVHSAAERAGAGMDQKYYVINKDRHIIETNEELALSGKYGRGAVIDVIGSEVIPVDKNGVNVLTTDLQSNTSASKVGEWLAETGCTGYTFYVFEMKYEGNVDFMAYTSNTVMEYVSVSDCSFAREFLMVVFGENSQVKKFDDVFKRKLGDDVAFDSCHVFMKEEQEDIQEGILGLTSSKCFSKNEANVKYDNTNYCYGLKLSDTDGVKFTLPNTFVYKKSQKSAGDDKNAVKAVLYTAPEVEIPEIIRQEVAVSEYDPKRKTYTESDVEFDVTVKGFMDGLPAAGNSDMNTSLGGNLVPEEKAVFMVTVENKDLPKGLYAVEGRLLCEPDGEIVNLQKFSESHSAGLEEYTEALKRECTPKVVNGVESTSQYILTTEKPSIYSKLLEFERIADELIAAGTMLEDENKVISFRVIIDNR